jgi:hypothetical protein
MTKTKTISRRTMLRGTGVAMALPWLEAMMPRTLLASPAAKAPVRMGFIFIPNGVNTKEFFPEKNPKTPGLPFSLQPLKPVMSSLLVISGLAHREAEGKADGAGDHARDSAVFLTGMHPVKTAGKDIKVGVSADQYAAQQIGHETRLPSLELGTEGGAESGNCDSGYSCAYSSNISWRTPSSPMAKETNPRNLFIRLFGDPRAAANEQEIAREATYMKSALDLVMDDAKRLRMRLGGSDQEKLDEYLEGVRAIEKQIQGSDKPAVAAPPGLTIPTGGAKDHQEHVRMLFDLVVAAFQTDSTRVFSFMMSNSGSNRSYPSIGVNDGHHTLSHHANDKDKLEKIKKIDRFNVEQFAYLLEKMNGIKEEGKTLLDNSMIVYGGAISDGNAHNHENLPVLLAGKGGGTLQSGRQIHLSGNTPMCGLFLSMFDRAKVKATTFGDGSKRVL